MMAPCWFIKGKFVSKLLLTFSLIILVVLNMGCNHLFYYPEPTIYQTPDQFDLEYEEHWVETEDQEKLHVWHIKPTRPEIGVVLHFHGNAQNMSTHFLFVAWLAMEGMHVVTFDYRGYGKSSGEPSRLGLGRDGVAMIRWLKANPAFSHLPRFVFGQSLGGAVSVPALVKGGEEGIQALILDSTFGSYREIARDKLASFWLTWPLSYPLGFLISREEDPYDYIGKLSLPLLITHGEKDEVVPPIFGERLFLASKSRDKLFWRLPGMNHTEAFITKDNSTRLRVFEYLKKKSVGASR